MKPTNHPCRQENDLPNLHDYVPCSSSGGVSRIALNPNRVQWWSSKDVKYGGDQRHKVEVEVCAQIYTYKYIYIFVHIEQYYVYTYMCWTCLLNIYAIYLSLNIYTYMQNWALQCIFSDKTFNDFFFLSTSSNITTIRFFSFGPFRHNWKKKHIV